MLEITISFVVTIILIGLWNNIATKKQNQIYAILMIGLKQDLNEIAIKLGYSDASKFWDNNENLLNKMSYVFLKSYPNIKFPSNI